MSPPRTAKVRPQPNSPIKKNLDQWIHEYELLQNEIVKTQLEIDSVKRTNARHEKEAMQYTQSNKTYRARIKEIMQQIESKQMALETTKGTSSQLELKVKQLKDEALRSRGQLEHLRKREHVLVQERELIAKEKKQVELQLHIMKESVHQLRMRCDRETALLRRDHLCIREQINYIYQRTAYTQELIELKLLRRRQALEYLHTLQSQSKSNLKAFVDHVRDQLKALNEGLEQSTFMPSQATTTMSAVSQCQDDVERLVKRIRSMAVEAIEQSHSFS
ncbi:hypothetical protein A0J61_09586 [Choanephora cucurbitarum]|uniref:Uncharacterized protein n=1 Tax=Choanephora cucurbitarum TaxID=101091 RepID=A0A1C7N160_9FUNG|nr:hypothetical protein A0J61_09586 [Choanephora cucurbitarum]